MYRGTLGSKDRPRPAYYCKHCHQAISGVEDLILEAFLNRMGDQLRLTAVEEVVEGGAVQDREASIRLRELGAELVNAGDDREAEIYAEMARVKAIQREARAQPAEVRLVPVADVRTFRADWEAAESDEQRRAIVGQALDRVLIRRGGRGAKSEAARLARMTFEWMPAGQIDTPTDEELAEWAAFAPWAE
jgi:site-specific DNA recombinase